MTANKASSDPVTGGDRLVAMQQADGHAAAAHYRTLLRHAEPPELADLAHFLCLLHGRRPGVIDHAATRFADPAARDWIMQATEAFVTERLYITRLTVAAGPVSGASEDDHSEAAAVELRSSFQMLAQSERRGCAAGAALALALDWPNLRAILDPLALRLGIEPPPCGFPASSPTLVLADHICRQSATARAFLFGSDQLFQLQRGAWRLLGARQRLRAE